MLLQLACMKKKQCKGFYVKLCHKNPIYLFTLKNVSKND